MCQTVSCPDLPSGCCVHTSLTCCQAVAFTCPRPLPSWSCYSVAPSPSWNQPRPHGKLTRASRRFPNLDLLSRCCVHLHLTAVKLLLHLPSTAVELSLLFCCFLLPAGPLTSEWAVCMGCMLGPYAWAVCLGCMLGPYAWAVCLDSTLVLYDRCMSGVRVGLRPISSSHNTARSTHT